MQLISKPPQTQKGITVRQVEGAFTCSQLFRRRTTTTTFHFSSLFCFSDQLSFGFHLEICPWHPSLCHPLHISARSLPAALRVPGARTSVGSLRLHHRDANATAAASDAGPDDPGRNGSFQHSHNFFKHISIRTSPLFFQTPTQPSFSADTCSACSLVCATCSCTLRFALFMDALWIARGLYCLRQPQHCVLFSSCVSTCKVVKAAE